MSESILPALLNNAAWLIVFVVVLDVSVGMKARGRLLGPAVPWLLGVGVAAVAMLAMLNGYRIETGVMFDTRSVILSLAGLILGPVPAAVGGAAAVALRWAMGGPGAVVGTAVILMSVGIGLAWRRHRRGSLAEIGAVELLLFGVTVHLPMLAAMLFLPEGQGWQVLQRIALPVLAVYPAVTMLLGLVMAKRLRQRREQEALAESEARWQFALEGAGDGVWDWNVPTGAVYFSRRLLEMLGLRPGDLRGHVDEWSERLHPEDRAATLAAVEDCLRGTTALYENEHRLRKADGTYIWVLDRGRVLERDREGRALRMIGTHADITVRRQERQTMADALALTEAVIRASPVGIVVFGADGRAIEANPAAKALLGWMAEALATADFREQREWRERGLTGLAERALADGVPVEAEVEWEAGETGRKATVEVQFVSFGRRAERRLLLLLRETTERVRAERRLHLLESALNAVPEGIVLTTADGAIEWANPGFTAMTGYRLEEVKGKTPRVLKSGRHDDVFYRGMWETIRRGEVWSGELSNRRADGTAYEERMTIAPVREASGAVRHFVAVKQDITEEKNIERQLRRSQRVQSIGLLAGGIAHDLNNVLAPILLSTSLLRPRLHERSQIELLDLTEAAAKRGASVVRQVLTFARGMDGERVALRPRDLVREVVDMIRETFPRTIAIRRDDTDAAPVLGDATQLHQVLLNLAVNARDAIPEGGSLRFAVRAQRVERRATRFFGETVPGDYVCISVTDTGCGMGEETLERIFDPFFTTKPRDKGTGLGLATVHGIVRGHRGFVEVKSEPGKGTQFEVYIPAAEIAPEPETPLLRGAGPVGAGRIVLVCDDEVAIRQTTALILQRLGFRVLQAGDGRQALAAWGVHREKIALVITDLMMPLVTGDRAAAEMLRVRPTLPVLFMSGLLEEAGAAVAEATRLYPAVQLLRKPFTQDDLVASVARLLEAGVPQGGGVADGGMPGGNAGGPPQPGAIPPGGARAG